MLNVQSDVSCLVCEACAFDKLSMSQSTGRSLCSRPRGSKNRVNRDAPCVATPLVRVHGTDPDPQESLACVGGSCTPDPQESPACVGGSCTPTLCRRFWTWLLSRHSGHCFPHVAVDDFGVHRHRCLTRLPGGRIQPLELWVRI